MSKQSDARAYAYFLLLNSTLLDELRSGLAKTFPLHITLKGRFSSAATEPIIALSDLGQRALGQFSSTTCQLEGPVVLDGGLIWYEVCSGDQAHGQIVRMHQSLEYALRESGLVVRDFMPAEYRLAGFRPHVSIAFGDTGSLVAKDWPKRVVATAYKWAIYEYAGIEVSAPASIVGEYPLAAERQGLR